MSTINALGFLEVYGLVAGIEAADAMLKSAQVRLLREHGVHPGLISLVVEGDLAACRAAVNAGMAAASRVGKVVSNNVIGRPARDTETMILSMLAGTGADTPAPKKAAPAKPATVAAPQAKEAPKPKAKPAATAKPVAKAKAAPAAKTKAASAAPAKAALDAVLAFIASAKQGRSWKEILKRFPNLPKGAQKQLDALVQSKELVKTGARYRAAGGKE